MSLTKIKNKNIDALINEYKLCDISIVKSNNMIFIMIKINSENLNANWKKLNSALSEVVEHELQDNFTRWNVYILYLSSNQIKKELKYKIENNTFFARKIIEDNYIFELTEENIEKLISNHINFTDLIMDETQINKEIYSSESKIYEQLVEIDTLNDNKIDEILILLEKDTKDEI